MKIIMGLGNPGSQYKSNRHNLGFRCIDLISKAHSVKISKVQCQSDVGQGKIDGTEVIIAKPRTFVNLSGQAAKRLLIKFKAEPGDLIVMHDDLDLSAGNIRVRMGGKSGGHRGIKSIIQCIGTEDFYRIRIGISRPFRQPGSVYNEEDVIDYVLGDIAGDEKALIEQSLVLAVQATVCLINEGLIAAMNKYNRRAS